MTDGKIHNLLMPRNIYGKQANHSALCRMMKMHSYIEAEKLNTVHFVERLATYRYYNMDQVVAQALTTFKNIAQS
jgi:UDP-galactopyranose mutase